MRRLLNPLFMVFLFIGLLGSMNTFAWKTVLRASVLKGTQEEATEKDGDGTAEELFALLLDEPELPEHPPLPVERNMGPSWLPSRELIQPWPPEQARAPRVVVVWQPSCLGSDEEPFLA